MPEVASEEKGRLRPPKSRCFARGYSQLSASTGSGRPARRAGTTFTQAISSSTRLCGEGAGSVGAAIQCPYHAWTYELDGRLRAAPNMADVAQFDRADHPLLPVPLTEWEGLLFVHLGDATAPTCTRT
ncbi:MAG TPA: Rieske 2Fe-2S domain-containing protein [Thermoanaerobaculia bacterium]|nr:Rieske 2Fe-2S domain-containing protein [Thermoanaerobaculia bacterium]